jgi:hypothetical protein
MSSKFRDPSKSRLTRATSSPSRPKGYPQNYSVVFSLGRNDIDIGGSVDGLVKNIRTMIDKHPADELKYVVTEIPAWHNEKIGAPEREELDAWNGRLKQEFGDAFIEPFRWLIDHREKSFALAGQTMMARIEPQRTMASFLTR